jgi:hypothetical protein
MTTAILTHPDCAQHEMGEGHPESPMRLKAILAALESSGLAAKLTMHEAPPAQREHLERVHHAEHVDMVFEAAPERGYAYLDPDTSMNPKSLSAALRAAGAVVRATDMVIGGEASNAFCAVRPPGHHATPQRPMGFCIFNNVAIGAMHAIERHGLERVCVLDFDVHHGNGTEDAFHEDPRVMLCSTFQHPYYPYCGADSGNEHIVNVPLPAMTDGRGISRSRRALLVAGARVVRAADGLRVRGIRRASRRSPRIPQARRRRLSLGDREAHGRGPTPRERPRRLHARGWLQHRSPGPLCGRARSRPGWLGRTLGSRFIEVAARIEPARSFLDAPPRSLRPLTLEVAALSPGRSSVTRSSRPLPQHFAEARDAMPSSHESLAANDVGRADIAIKSPFEALRQASRGARHYWSSNEVMPAVRA